MNTSFASNIRQALEESFLTFLLLRMYVKLTTPLITVRRMAYRKPADWSKMNYHEKVRWRCKHPEPHVDYGKWVNKYHAKEAVKHALAVTPYYAYVRHPGEIDVSRLPPTFVMKAAHGWRMNLLVRDGIICGAFRDLSLAGLPANGENLRNIASRWLTSPRFEMHKLREQQYRYPETGVLFEQYVPIDYQLKFFLFRGRFRMCVALAPTGDFTVSPGNSIRLYDQDWAPMDAADVKLMPDWRHAERSFPAPAPELLEALYSLFRDIDHVRVDFMVSEGIPYFCELTFTHQKGKPGVLARLESELGQYWL